MVYSGVDTTVQNEKWCAVVSIPLHTTFKLPPLKTTKQWPQLQWCVYPPPEVPEASSRGRNLLGINTFLIIECRETVKARISTSLSELSKITRSSPRHPQSSAEFPGSCQSSSELKAKLEFPGAPPRSLQSLEHFRVSRNSPEFL